MPDHTPLKRCSKCGIEKPATAKYFRVRTSKTTTYFRNECKSCQHEYERQYRGSHREKTIAYLAQYYIDHRKEILEYSAKHQSENRDQYNAYGKAYYLKNRNKVNATCRAWAIAHHGRVLENQRRHRKLNPDLYRAKKQRRRAKERKANGIFTDKDVAIQYESQNGKCWWCGIAVGDQYHVDHRIPLAKGGSNWPENICISCPECNLKKNDKMPWEFNGRLL